MGCSANKAAGTPAGVVCDFSVTVDKAAAESAGLKSLPSADGKYLVVEKVNDNAIVQDKTKADAKVCPGDHVVCVNGIHGDATKMLDAIEKAAKKAKLNLAIKKAVAVAPSAEKAKESGEPATTAESRPEAGPETAPQTAAHQDVPLKEDGTPIFDGVWNPKALINGKKLIWLIDNTETELTFIGQNKCSVMFEGKVYTATMEEENKLVWDDGDVWERGELAAQQPGEPRASEKKESACAGLC